MTPLCRFLESRPTGMCCWECCEEIGNIESKHLRRFIHDVINSCNSTHSDYQGTEFVGWMTIQNGCNRHELH